MTGSDASREMTCDQVREMAGAFVLGALDPDDEAAVRAHLETCSDAHAEIAELGGVLPVLAESAPLVEPPAGLKARLMAAAAADLETRSTPDSGLPAAVGDATIPAASAASIGAAAAAITDPTTAAEDEAAVQIAAVAAAAAAPQPIAFPDASERAAIEAAAVASAAGAPQPIAFPDATERAARRSTSTSSWILRIAAVVAIIGLAGWNMLLRNQLDTAQSYERSVAAVIDAAGQPGALTAILTSDTGTGTGLAAISSTGQVTLAMQDLAATSGATVYTTWAIGADNVPVALGDFTVGPSGTASFTATAPVSAPGVVIALTLEPGPGATVPTGPIVSKGAAT